jgi:hypothetical protein
MSDVLPQPVLPFKQRGVDVPFSDIEIKSNIFIASSVRPGTSLMTY